MNEHKGIFKKRYALKGRDWIKNISKEDRDVFVSIGLEKAQHGHLGGLARSHAARRDEKGRFVKNE